LFFINIYQQAKFVPVKWWKCWCCRILMGASFPSGHCEDLGIWTKGACI